MLGEEAPPEGPSSEPQSSPSEEDLWASRSASRSTDGFDGRPTAVEAHPMSASRASAASHGGDRVPGSSVRTVLEPAVAELLSSSPSPSPGGVRHGTSDLATAAAASPTQQVHDRIQRFKSQLQQAFGTPPARAFGSPPNPSPVASTWPPHDDDASGVLSSPDVILEAQPQVARTARSVCRLPRAGASPPHVLGAFADPERRRSGDAPADRSSRGEQQPHLDEQQPRVDEQQPSPDKRQTSLDTLQHVETGGGAAVEQARGVGGPLVTAGDRGEAGAGVGVCTAVEEAAAATIGPVAAVLKPAAAATGVVEAPGVGIGASAGGKADAHAVTHATGASRAAGVPGCGASVVTPPAVAASASRASTAAAKLADARPPSAVAPDNELRSGDVPPPPPPPASAFVHLSHVLRDMQREVHLFAARHHRCDATAEDDDDATALSAQFCRSMRSLRAAFAAASAVAPAACSEFQVMDVLAARLLALEGRSAATADIPDLPTVLEQLVAGTRRLSQQLQLYLRRSVAPPVVRTSLTPGAAPLPRAGPPPRHPNDAGSPPRPVLREVACQRSVSVANVGCQAAHSATVSVPSSPASFAAPGTDDTASHSPTPRRRPASWGSPIPMDNSELFRAFTERVAERKALLARAARGAPGQQAQQEPHWVPLR